MVRGVSGTVLATHVMAPFCLRVSVECKEPFLCKGCQSIPFPGLSSHWRAVCHDEDVWQGAGPASHLSNCIGSWSLILGRCSSYVYVLALVYELRACVVRLRPAAVHAPRGSTTSSRRYTRVSPKPSKNRPHRCGIIHLFQRCSLPLSLTFLTLTSLPPCRLVVGLIAPWTKG